MSLNIQPTAEHNSSKWFPIFLWRLLPDTQKAYKKTILLGLESVHIKTKSISSLVSKEIECKLDYSMAQYWIVGHDYEMLQIG